MNAALIIPWLDDGTAERRSAFEYVREWWRYQFSGLSLIVTPGSRPWSKGQAVDNAVKATTDDVLIVVDADVIPHPRAIEAAISAALVSGWVVPYGFVYRLSNETSRQIEGIGARDVEPEHLGRDHLDLARGRYRGRPAGGCVVLTRAAYEAVGGIDPRFEGWGGEDLAMAVALRTLVNPFPTRLELPLWHLWHPNSPSMGERYSLSHENARLLSRYRKARRSRDRMREVIAEHRGELWRADHAADDQLVPPQARRRSV